MHIILFDIDGTLISSGGAGKSAIEGALRETFDITPDSAGVPMAGRTDRSIVRDLFVQNGLENTEVNWTRVLESYLRVLPNCLQQCEGQVLPGVVELLDVLRARENCHLGLLTGNIEYGARLKLKYYGLLDFFSFGGFGDHCYDRSDVAREAWDASRNLVGDKSVNRKRVWVIGDTPADIHCGRSIGANVLAVATGWHSREILETEKPDLLFDDFSDPTRFLQVLSEADFCDGQD